MSFDGNIRALEAASASGGISLMGINPIDVLIIGQKQMKSASLELRRSSNVGIGYAYDLQKDIRIPSYFAVI